MSGYVPTPEQTAVIEYPLEPLRISAGAGTGKTATLTDRLAYCVRERGLRPETALGITFTNKAAEELADRLRRALPGEAEDGREVEVTTYHGFAYTLLQEYGAFVGVERDTEVIGPGYVRQMLFEGLEGQSFRILDLAAPSQRVDEAATLAGQLGDNLLTARDLMNAAPAEPTGPWPARLELAAIVDRYEQAKRRAGVVDYADLIRLAHELVSGHTEVAARVRERYEVVVLDEYQDTAPAQRELLRLLFGGGFPVTAVGDSDQTIYEWRGASLANFDAFPEHFTRHDGSAARSLDLSMNHRSGPVILGVANRVRRHLHGDHAFTPLVPAPRSPDDAAEARWFRTATDEASWIADEIVRLHDEEGIAWRDIAVLFRKNRQIGLVRDALAVASVPVEVASLGGLLEVPEVAELVAWLRVLHFRDDTVSLARVLLGSRYRMGLGDLAPLVRWAGEQGMWRSDREGPSWPLLETIDRLEEVNGLTAEARARLFEFRTLYRSLLTSAQSLSLIELCRTVLDGIDAWDEIEAMPSSTALSARLNLYRFLDLAQEWSPLEGRPSLEAFLGYLDLLLTDNATEELDTARVGGSDAVSLLTIHRAKGLEWDTVFLPALAEGIFPARSLGHDNPADYPRYVPYRLRLDAAALPDLESLEGKERSAVLSERHLSGEWRTAYVAVTRAERRLYLSGAYWYEGKRPKGPSALYETARDAPSVVETVPAPEPGDRPERLAIEIPAPVPDPVFGHGWREALRSALDDPAQVAGWAAEPDQYDAEVRQLQWMVDHLPTETTSDDTAEMAPLSVTGLVTLDGCALRFFWNEVEPLPRRPTDAIRRGIEVHRRIELHNRGAMSFDEIDDDLYDAPGESAAPGADPFQNFVRSRFGGRSPRFIEAPIDLLVGEARIRGRIDAVYESEDGAWEIVDYKSGRLPDQPPSMVQLQAYALAAKSGAISPNPPDDLRVAFLYLGGATAEEAGAVADAAWVEAAETSITGLVEKSRGPEYPAEPSESCRHCDFLRFCEAGREFLESGA